jgi:hypothetical protein
LTNDLETVDAVWQGGYSGTGPASTTIGYDVVITGTPDQSMTWGLEVKPEGGSFVPIAGGTFFYRSV